MGNVKFLSVPANLISEKPEGWNFQTLSEWLQRLSVNELEHSTRKICSLLQALQQSNLKPAVQAELLSEIMEYTKQFEYRVEYIYLDSALPLEEYPQHCVEWLVWCYLEMADCFFMLAEKTEQPAKEANCLYWALHALSRAYLHTVAIYFDPVDGFWYRCNRIFALAETKGLLNIKISCTEFAEHSINHLYKLLMVFSVCDLRQFRPREMRRVFEFLSQHVHPLEIGREVGEDSLKGTYQIDLGTDSSPQNLDKIGEYTANPANRFFATAKFARMIYRQLKKDRSRSGQPKPVDMTVLTRMIKSLALVSTRQYQRKDEQYQLQGIIGFNNIKTYLGRDKDVKAKPTHEDLIPPRPGEPITYDTSQFELVGEGEELVYHMSANLKRQFKRDTQMRRIMSASGDLSKKVPIWGKQPVTKKTVVETNAFSTLNTSAKGYGVAVINRQAKVTVGEIFTVVIEPGPEYEVSIIRHIRRLSTEKLYIGAELIGFAKEVVTLRGTGQKKKESKALFLPGIDALKQPDTVVFDSEEFQIGELVMVTIDFKEVPCLLRTLVDSTACFSQAELFYLPSTEKFEN